MAADKQYWLGLDDKHESQEAQENHEGLESGVSALDSITETITTKKSGRRDFLKMMGFSLTAAAIAASCEVPVRNSIPYTIRPEEIKPGIPNYYASMYAKGGNFNTFLVKAREGRPIMMEGNPDSKLSQGGVNAKTLGSLLNLYDNARFRFPLIDGAKSDWATINTELKSELEKLSAAGEKIAILSSTVISPSTKAAIEQFAATYTTTEWIQYDAISAHGILEANKMQYGKRAIPSYYFDKAELILGIGADFLGTSFYDAATDYANGRKVSAEHPEMSRHIQIESIPTLTGSNADMRIPVKPSQEDLAVVNIYNAIAKKAGSATVSSTTFENAKVDAVAEELWAAKGKSLVVSGSNSTATQTLINGINTMLGNNGNTVDINVACYNRQGDDTKAAQLLTDMNAGNVGAVIVMDANPAYSLGEAFVSGIEKVKVSVDFSERVTETSSFVKYACPTHHYLEAWADAMPKDGFIATAQPTIPPLFDTQQAEESLLKWAGDNTAYYDFMKKVWQDNFVSKSQFSSVELLWNNTVHDGETALDIVQVTTGAFDGSADYSAAAAEVTQNAKTSDMELKLYEKVQIGDGSVADNPWMQELADPITRICWDNYIVANPSWVDSNGLLHNRKNKKYNTAKFSVNGVEMTLPVVALEGVPAGVFGIAYGYGRSNVRHEELERGTNVYPLTDRANFTDKFEISGGELAGDQFIAIVQQEHKLTHTGLGASDDSIFTSEKTRLIVKETTLEEYKENAAAGNYINDGMEMTDRKHWVEGHLMSLYGDESAENPATQEYGGAHEGALSQGHHWGMGIDLNSCTGCGACVVACNVENNVPIVGRTEVRRAHDMNWLRIDKYHTGDEENPQVIFQPMMCQHCDNAPCENVCPVAATNHSTEGLNQMTYNRCIGTRYCANNCPYKVRRFNWFDYQGADSFSNNKGFIWNNDFDASQTSNSFGAMMDGENNSLGLHNPLTKMVLNPDVTVRSRGVIEKCSFCVQRVQLGKLDAKKDGRALKDSDVVTACQSVCPTNAITFGDTNNPKSAVSKDWADPRAYGVIEEIHTLPSVRYLVKVRNQKEGDLA